MNLFVYGELARARVLYEVLGRLPEASVAVLPGYSRRPDPETGFFVAVASPGAEVAGLLLSDIAAAEIAALDAFEGVAEGAYRRAAAEVMVLEPQATVLAEVYVAGERSR